MAYRIAARKQQARRDKTVLLNWAYYYADATPDKPVKPQ
jgi:hypothetical protein